MFPHPEYVPVRICSFHVFSLFCLVILSLFVCNFVEKTRGDGEKKKGGRERERGEGEV